MLHACFYTICLVFRYTSRHFYAFSRTNLLTRCHSASSLFFAVFVFQKSYTGNSRNWTKQKLNVQKFTEASREPKRRRKGARRRPHHQGARPRAWPRRPMLRAPWSTSDATPSPIKTPRREKPKYPITFLEYIAIRCRRQPEIGKVQKLFSAPCRRGESPPEVFFIAMLSSGAMSE
jgi:hypothetical protein